MLTLNSRSPRTISDVVDASQTVDDDGSRVALDQEGAFRLGIEGENGPFPRYLGVDVFVFAVTDIGVEIVGTGPDTRRFKRPGDQSAPCECTGRVGCRYRGRWHRL